MESNFDALKQMELDEFAFEIARKTGMNKAQFDNFVIWLWEEVEC